MRPEPEPKHISEPIDESKELKLLIAEDNIMNQEVVVNMLNHLGFFNITLAVNGIELLNKLLSDERYDLVFVDLKMPKMSGIAAIDKFTKEKPNDKTLLVALTASITQDIKEKCREVGMKGFIAKPVNMNGVKT